MVPENLTAQSSPIIAGEGHESSTPIIGGRGADFIRPATLADGGRVFELLTQFATSYKPERRAFDTIFPDLISSPAAYLPIAESAGVVVGYALALRVPTLFANGTQWLLQEIMVDPAHRGNRIGTRLLDAVIAHARAENAVEVVVATRRAGGFYAKHGFTESAAYYKLKLADTTS